MDKRKISPLDEHKNPKHSESVRESVIPEESEPAPESGFARPALIPNVDVETPKNGIGDGFQTDRRPN